MLPFAAPLNGQHDACAARMAIIPHSVNHQVEVSETEPDRSVQSIAPGQYMSDESNENYTKTGWMRDMTDQERRAFDRVAFHLDAELALPDGTTTKGEIVNVSLVGFLFTSETPVEFRGEARLSIGDEVSGLKINIVDTSQVGLHLETYPGETDIRDLALNHPSIARLFLPYIYNYDGDN